MKYCVDQAGTCPICDREVHFTAKNEWLRDHLFCSGCGSIPRERALMQVIKTYYPNYRELTIHESSPCFRGASLKLKNECRNYSASYFYPDIALGSCHPIYGFRCENLQDMTFIDESFDLFITQDVMEHIFDPEKTFKEIARILRHGGAHIFSVPLINKSKRSMCLASLGETGEIEYHHEPEYHGNPIDNGGSLVTMHWGYDLASFIMKAANTPTTIVTIDNIELGIQGEYIEILVSIKE